MDAADVIIDTPKGVTLTDQQRREIGLVALVRAGIVPDSWKNTPAFMGAKYSPDQPRDDHGRFGSGGGGASSAKPAVFLARERADASARQGTTDSTVALARSLEREKYNNAFNPYPDYEEFADNAPGTAKDEDGNALPAPDHWEPGTAAALSQSATKWQSSYEDSEQMQAAADALLGHEPAGGLNFTNEDAAAAREILTAMTGEGPAGAVNGNAGYIDENPNVEIHTENFGPGELARGVDDPDGSIMGAFQAAKDSGSDIEWSMASFAMGGEEGQAFQDANAASGGGYIPAHDDGTALNANEMAANTALKYTYDDNEGTAPKAPVLIRTSGTGLSIDGGFEAVVGGKFQVVSIHQAQTNELAAWNSYHSPFVNGGLTVVQLKQTENVKLPPGVATT